MSGRPRSARFTLQERIYHISQCDFARVQTLSSEELLPQMLPWERWCTAQEHEAYFPRRAVNPMR